MQFKGLLKECKPFLITEQQGICQVGTNKQKTALFLRFCWTFPIKGSLWDAAVMPLQHQLTEAQASKESWTPTWSSFGHLSFILCWCASFHVISSNYILQHVISNNDFTNTFMIGWEKNATKNAYLTGTKLDLLVTQVCLSISFHRTFPNWQDHFIHRFQFSWVRAKRLSILLKCQFMNNLFDMTKVSFEGITILYSLSLSTRLIFNCE